MNINNNHTINDDNNNTNNNCSNNNFIMKNYIIVITFPQCLLLLFNICTYLYILVQLHSFMYGLCSHCHLDPQAVLRHSMQTLVFLAYRYQGSKTVSVLFLVSDDFFNTCTSINVLLLLTVFASRCSSMVY